MIFRTIITLVSVAGLSIIGMTFARLIGGRDEQFFAVGVAAGVLVCCTNLILFHWERAQ